MNTYSMATMYIDKQRAIKHQWRISERHLWLAAFLGGGLGAFFGMHIFHHKTRHWKFHMGLPAIAVIQGVLATLYYMK